MALTHLADTSVLTRLRVSAVESALRQLLRERRVVRSSLSDLELGYSARSSAEWDRIAAAAAVLPDVTLVPADLRRALAVQRMLAGAGLKGRKVPDLLIAAAAERNGLVLLHYDHDFELIAQITGQPQEWIVQCGSID